MEFVGNEARDRGLDDEACIAAAKDAIRLFCMGRLRLQYNEQGAICHAEEAPASKNNNRKKNTAADGRTEKKKQTS
jgi:hypothetical protein